MLPKRTRRRRRTRPLPPSPRTEKTPLGKKRLDHPRRRHRPRPLPPPLPPRGHDRGPPPRRGDHRTRGHARPLRRLHRPLLRIRRRSGPRPRILDRPHLLDRRADPLHPPALHGPPGRGDRPRRLRPLPVELRSPRRPLRRRRPRRLALAPLLQPLRLHARGHAPGDDAVGRRPALGAQVRSLWTCRTTSPGEGSSSVGGKNGWPGPRSAWASTPTRPTRGGSRSSRPCSAATPSWSATGRGNGPPASRSSPSDSRRSAWPMAHFAILDTDVFLNRYLVAGVAVRKKRSGTGPSGRGRRSPCRSTTRRGTRAPASADYGAMGWALGPLAYAGLAICLSRWRSPPHLLLALAFVAGLGVLLLGQPDNGEYRRALLMVPFSFGMAGIAAVTLGRWAAAFLPPFPRLRVVAEGWDGCRYPRLGPPRRRGRGKLLGLLGGPHRDIDSDFDGSERWPRWTRPTPSTRAPSTGIRPSTLSHPEASVPVPGDAPGRPLA